MRTNPVVERLLDEQTLLHPVPEDVPSYLDLIRYIERMHGRTDLPAPRSLEHRIGGFVGAPRHLVFFLIDGLGLNVSPHFPRGGFFERTFACELRALFPSTTANVLTATTTARWPAENGITGWWTHLPNRGRTVAPLPLVDRETDRSARELGIEPGDVFPAKPGAAPETGTRVHVVPEELRRGEFTSWTGSDSHIAGYSDAGEIGRLILEAPERSQSGSYTSVYIPDVDTLSHTHGYDSPEVGALIAKLDRLLEDISVGLPSETRLIVTADHGQVCIPPDRHLCVYEDDPLLEFLDTPPSGEATVPLFHVSRGRHEEFRTWFEASRFGNWFELLSTDHALYLGLYGQGAISERMKQRLGTFTGIASEPVLLDYVPTGRKPLEHLGSHGGLRPQEMRLGLFVHP
ncbi:MAG: alkaline phosphatase family protein [Spirochaetota bacterium]